MQPCGLRGAKVRSSSPKDQAVPWVIGNRIADRHLSQPASLCKGWVLPMLGFACAWVRSRCAPLHKLAARLFAVSAIAAPKDQALRQPIPPKQGGGFE